MTAVGQDIETKPVRAAATSAFAAFAIAVAIATPVIYVIAEIGGFPLFTYHPGTNRFDLGWAAARANEGPAMYWYGWIATTIIGDVIVGTLAAVAARGAVQKIPLFLIWLLPLAALAILAWVLMPFWTK